MGVNKVTLNTPTGEEVVVDFSNDTVTAETLADGVTAHGADGEEIVGTLKPVLYTPQTLTEEQKAQARQTDLYDLLHWQGRSSRSPALNTSGVTAHRR